MQGHVVKVKVFEVEGILSVGSVVSRVVHQTEDDASGDLSREQTLPDKGQVALRDGEAFQKEVIDPGAKAKVLQFLTQNISPLKIDRDMLKHVWRNRYIDRELFARQGRLLRNSIAEINIIGKNLWGVGRNVRKFWSRLNN